MAVGAEGCDDGNTVGGDGCSASCAVESTLTEDCTNGADDDGDGLADCDDDDCEAACAADEVCDDGTDNDLDGETDCADADCAAFSDCVTPTEEDCAVAGDEDGNGSADCADEACTCECGDGVVQGDEQCDDGDDNNDVTADSCRTSCSVPYCGDGVVDAGEECDTDGTAAQSCEACTLVDRLECGDSGRFLDVSVGTDALSTFPLFFDAGAADDFAPPASCSSLNGSDITVQVTSSTSATYLVSVIGGSLTGRFVLSEWAACGSTTSSACSATTRSRPAALVLTLEESATRVLRLEGVGGNLQAQLQLRRVDSVVQPGGTCVADDASNPCLPGFECTENTGMFVCTQVAEVPGTLGEPCAPDSALPECVPGTFCDAESRTCAASPETTCEGRPLYDDLVEDAGEGELVVELVPSLGTVRGSCESYPAVALINLDEPRNAWMRAVVRSVDGSPVALSMRSRCGVVDSEEVCVRSPEGDATATAYLAPGDDGGTLIVSGYSSVIVSVEKVPTRTSGQSCDPERIENRCDTGLSCQSGQCLAPLAGSCGDPVPGFVAAEGDLTGRGLTFAFDTASITAAPRNGCDGNYRSQVFEFTAPSAGQVTVRFTGASSPSLLQIVRDCYDTPDLAACDELSTASLSVARNERFQVIVSNAGDASGVITLQLQVQSDAGGACSDELSCRGTLNCVSGVCRLPTVAAGVACVLGESECVAGNACLPFGDAFLCLPRVVGDRSPCGVFAGLPTCSPGLECLIDGGVQLCADPDVVSGRCDSSDECAPGFTCLDNRCEVSTGVGVGESCDVLTPGVCAEGLACVVPPEGSLADATCQTASAGCGPTNPCTSPQVCVEAVCYTPLIEDAPCTAGSGAPCGPSLACQAGSCQPDLGGLGTACTESDECQDGLFCAVNPPFDPTCAPRREAGGACSPAGDPLQCADGLNCVPDMFAIYVCTAP
jgi:cysteine-rich repeat protein